jgi:hypothetical protein
VLNDVTMLLHISQDHTHVEVVSFPRDMYVSVPECPNPNDPGRRAARRAVEREDERGALVGRPRMRGSTSSS